MDSKLKDPRPQLTFNLRSHWSTKGSKYLKTTKLSKMQINSSFSLATYFSNSKGDFRPY